MEEVFLKAEEEFLNNNNFAIATVIKTSGSTPQKPGAKLLVKNDKTAIGTLGGGCVEGDIWFAASEMLKNKTDSEMKEYELNEDLAAEDGLVCGGTMFFLLDNINKSESLKKYNQEIISAYNGGSSVSLATLVKKPITSLAKIGDKILIRENKSTSGTLGDEILDNLARKTSDEVLPLGRNKYVSDKRGYEFFIEAYTNHPTLVIAGGGHVSKAIYNIAITLGYKIIIIDDREKFSNPKRFPKATSTLVGDYSKELEKINLGTNSFIVIATRGHKYDAYATAAALRTNASYVGLLGSKRKAILIYEELFSNGFSYDEVSEIHSPIGLDLSARTPEEISLSIMAEITAFRLGGKGNFLKLDKILIDKALKKSKTT